MMTSRDVLVSIQGNYGSVRCLRKLWRRGAWSSECITPVVMTYNEPEGACWGGKGAKVGMQNTYRVCREVIPARSVATSAGIWAPVKLLQRAVCVASKSKAASVQHLEPPCAAGRDLGRGILLTSQANQASNSLHKVGPVSFTREAKPRSTT